MKRLKLFVSLSAVGVVTAFALAFQGLQVTLNGKPVSGRMLDGSVYVKLADVAKALDQVVVKKGSGYEVVPAGGTNALVGTAGKKGEELFTGKWKFLVKEVSRSDAYMLQYADSKFELTADPGQDVVVVQCRFKSGVKDSANIYFNGLGNTALADMNEQTYKPKWMDVAGGVASMMLPGSAKDFAIVFMVPESAELKDLIYTIEPVDSSKYGVTDLRISLK